MKSGAAPRPVNSCAKMMDKVPLGGGEFPEPDRYRSGHEIHFKCYSSFFKLSRHRVEHVHAIRTRHIRNADKLVSKH
jgi:hypothetical protein